MGSSWAGVVFCAFSLIVGEVGVAALKTDVKQRAKAPIELPVRQDGGSFQQRCFKGESGGTADSPCVINATLRTESLIYCSRHKTVYWPPGWSSMNRGGCAHPPTLDWFGAPEPCKEYVKWRDHGVRIIFGGKNRKGWWRLFRIQMPQNRPSSLGKVVAMYGFCRGKANKRPLFWKLNFIPEPPPTYNNIATFRFEKQWDLQHNDYLVNLHRGDGLFIRLEGMRDPPKAMVEGGEYCKSKVTGMLTHCERTSSWEGAGVTVKRAAWAHAVTMTTEPKDVEGQVQDAFFKVMYWGFERRFHIRVLPTLTPRFVHAYFYEKGFHQCQPSDGPTPQQACDGGAVKESSFIYVNCTEVGPFDPPDINTPSGSFCAEPYTDYNSPCKSTRKWFELFEEADVRSENQLFSVYNGRHSLTEPATVYGRCGSTKGAVLFFQFKLELPEDEAESGRMKPSV